MEVPHGEAGDRLPAGAHFRTARTIGRHCKVPKHASGVGSAGTHRFDECGHDARADRTNTRNESDHGGQVAAPVFPRWGEWPLRRVAVRPPPIGQRRACSPARKADPGDETEQRDALECSPDRGGDQTDQVDGAPYLASFWAAAASAETFQTFHRPVFCREASRYRGSLLTPTPKSGSPVRR